MSVVIGLSGKARHGKGSVVQLAQIWMQKGDDESEVRQVSFATALKQTARRVVELLPMRPPAGWQMTEAGLTFGEEEAAVMLNVEGLDIGLATQVVILARGLGVDDLVAKTPQARKLLQFIGTEAFRKNVDDLYWVKRAARTIESLPSTTKVVFVPDARFPNEADYVRKMGGEMWRVERYVKPMGAVFIEPFDNGLSAEAKAHPSETALDDYKFDATLKASDMDGLFHAVEEQLKRLGLV